MLAFDAHGTGRALLFVHAGIADRRMWDAQVAAFATDHRVVRCDLRGYGDTPLGAEPYALHEDVAALIDTLALAPVVVVGASMGGAAAIDLALTRADAVRALVLAGTALGGHPFAEADTHAGWTTASAAFDRGDREGAAAIELAMWLPGRGRTLDDVDAAVRARVHEMLLRSYAMQSDGETEEIELDPPAAERLAEIRCPTLVVVGDLDTADIHAVAERVPGARRATIADAAHLPSMERPAQFNDVLRAFLNELPGSV